MGINNNIFEEYSKYIVPIKSVSTSEPYILSKQNSEKSYFVVTYPYAEGMRYYPADNITQLRNFAEKYACVQKCLSSIKEGSKYAKAAKRSISKQLDTYDIFKCANEQFRNLETAAYRSQDRFSKLFFLYEDILYDTRDRIIHSKRKNEYQLCLHDLHPHNVFFPSRGDKCVLIYDYELVLNEWTLDDALAFTLHRFVREHIVGTGKSFSDARAEIQNLGENFLEVYNRIIGHTSQDKLQIDLGIRRTNFAKFVYVMGVHYGFIKYHIPTTDQWLYSEARKFIGYLKEARFFSDLTNP